MRYTSTGTPASCSASRTARRRGCSRRSPAERQVVAEELERRARLAGGGVADEIGVYVFGSR
jgi:hypothetical protein